MAKHRTHSIEFKRQVAQEFLAGETLHGLAKRPSPSACRSRWQTTVGGAGQKPGRERYGKGVARRQVWNRKANTRELPFKCRKCSNDIESGE
jgi:hypothetical protein